MSLAEMVLRIHEQAGFCIAPHPMAGGIVMKSLSTHFILDGLHNPAVTRTLIGIETYNAQLKTS